MIKTSPYRSSRNDWYSRILRLLNLRPEEGDRTSLMLIFYTITSIGMVWLELAVNALFIKECGSENLPFIYIASAVMGSGLGFLYSWLQNTLPLKRVFFIIALIMSLPLFIFRFGIDPIYFAPFMVRATVFMLRLWIDAQDILNDLNTQVAANQIFNIREIKRTYPIISSGLLIGDVIAGFSLSLLLIPAIGEKNVLLAASLMIIVGGGILIYLTKKYKQAFPDTPIKEFEDLKGGFASKKTSISLKKYIFPLFAFFILGEVLYLLVEFQYFGELDAHFLGDERKIAQFLGVYSGILGIVELMTQWFVSSRAVERLGVFIAAMFLPISLSVLGGLTLILNQSMFTSAEILFVGSIILRFFDELLRYTLIAGIEPFLFQPLPSELRSSIQTFVKGVSEPIATGVTGISIFLLTRFLAVAFTEKLPPQLRELQGWIFITAIVIFSAVWALSAWLLRSNYVNLLVEGAEKGRIGFSDVNLKAFKKAILDSLARKTTEADQKSCIDLLARIDPMNAGEVLSPLLMTLAPSLQKRSLDVMLKNPSQAYRLNVQKLVETKPPLEVLGLALRYLWLSQSDLNPQILKPYLNDRVDAVVRGTAASILFRQGNDQEKKNAQITLEKMLESYRDRERVIGTQALQDLGDMDFIVPYLSRLLQDNSPKVRCASLEVIGSKRIMNYYPSLLKGLSYKSTREVARRTLVKMGNDALPLLINLAQDSRQSDFMRSQMWGTMAEIATTEALSELVQQLISSWGLSRRNLLRILLKTGGDTAIEMVLEQIGRSGIETLIDQELLLLGQIYGCRLDFNSDQVSGQEVDLLTSALIGMQKDILERCFLLMQFLYPLSSIQAALLNLDSDSQNSIALGLELLDNTLDLPQKALILELLEGGLNLQLNKLEVIDTIVPYQPMKPSDRLRHLITFRHFLSDWTLACCFHLGRSQRWTISKEATLVCLRHPSNIVREAVLWYLKEASPRICLELLPLLKNDPNPIVSAQVMQFEQELQGII
jgi:ATP/ADP translocase/HEAT repeat protein